MPSVGRVGASVDDLILRLAGELGNPHSSVRLAQHQRIAKKIDDAYARGDLDRAARWDERLTGWEERVDDAMADASDNWLEYSGGRAIDDEGTGVAIKMAGRYEGAPEYMRNSGLADNLRAIAEDGIGRWPAPRQPSDEEIIAFARQLSEERQALRDRYRRAAETRTVTADQLIDRLSR